MAREWAIHAYKARLDSAIEAERWDEADRVRVAAKRRLLEMVGKGGSENEIAAARDALANSSDRLRLSKRLRIDNGALTTAVRLSTDAETAGIAAEQVLLPADTARDVKERIVQILSSGNRRPWSTTELAQETARRVETVARALSRLRADRKIISRRIGRHVLHSFVEHQHNTLMKVIHTTTNTPANEDQKSNLLSNKIDLLLSKCSSFSSTITIGEVSVNSIIEVFNTPTDTVSHSALNRLENIKSSRPQTFSKYESMSDLPHEYQHDKH